jgi:kynureninase
MSMQDARMDAREAEALALDAADPLAHYRDQFLIPKHGDGGDQRYFCGNSLGLQPRSTRKALQDELDDWQALGVEAHFHGRHPWMPYHEFVRDGLAHVAGALPSEVVAMNTLTTNLHLMMVSFYRPTADRAAILIEKNAFPSDRHAVVSQLQFHGFDPDTHLIEVGNDGEAGHVSLAQIEAALQQHRVALVLWPGVQYLSGQRFDLAAITRIAHAHGAVAGFDLAHAIGNVPVDLHDANADFAVWCSYKYLNAGPGAIAGCFVHQRHARTDRPRFAGWWGHRADTRFRMQPGFEPSEGADGWQLSNPSIFSLAPLRTSLDLFQQAGLHRLRQKSVALTGWLAQQINSRLGALLSIRTPDAADDRGAQLSLRVHHGVQEGRALFAWLQEHGFVLDWREPDILRAAPTPLYNRYSDCLQFVRCCEAFMRR